jgi:hypothetical protein
MRLHNATSDKTNWRSMNGKTGKKRDERGVDGVEKEKCWGGGGEIGIFKNKWGEDCVGCGRSGMGARGCKVEVKV